MTLVSFSNGVKMKRATRKRKGASMMERVGVITPLRTSRIGS